MDMEQGAVAADMVGTSPDSRLIGVKGWLLFFCVTLVILNPLATLGLLVWSLSLVAPVFDRFPGLIIVSVLDGVVSIALMGLSVYAGIALWRVKPGAVKVARVFLFAGVAYLLISPLFVFLAGLPQGAAAASLPDAYINSGRSLLYYGIWLNYLKNSKRVKATYDSSTPD